MHFLYNIIPSHQPHDSRYLFDNFIDNIKAHKTNESNSKINARQILDSRGNPTVEADVFTESGYMGRAAVPSELRLENMKQLNLEMVIKESIWAKVF